MPRESIEDKGLRYIRERRLTVERVDGDLVVARCKGGSGEEYALGFDPRAGQWRCTCPCRRTCAHLTALQMVTTRRRR